MKKRHGASGESLANHQALHLFPNGQTLLEKLNQKETITQTVSNFEDRESKFNLEYKQMKQKLH